MSSLPYVTSPGNIEKALKGIKAASTPDRVTQDFVKTVLQIPGGSGTQINSFLKKIGFKNNDGTPSDTYKRFRNAATSGQAIAEALRTGYASLYKRNEYMHKLSDSELRGLIIEETGQSADSSSVSLTLSAIKRLKKFADFSSPASADDQTTPEEEVAEDPHEPMQLQLPPHQHGVGLNLAYTINLHLPATSDISVFNAIFKSLRENLLKGQGNE